MYIMSKKLKATLIDSSNKTHCNICVLCIPINVINFLFIKLYKLRTIIKDYNPIYTTTYLYRDILKHIYLLIVYCVSKQKIKILIKLNSFCSFSRRQLYIIYT